MIYLQRCFCNRRYYIIFWVAFIFLLLLLLSNVRDPSVPVNEWKVFDCTLSCNNVVKYVHFTHISLVCVYESVRRNEQKGLCACVTPWFVCFLCVCHVWRAPTYVVEHIEKVSRIKAKPIYWKGKEKTFCTETDWLVQTGTKLLLPSKRIWEEERRLLYVAGHFFFHKF